MTVPGESCKEARSTTRLYKKSQDHVNIGWWNAIRMYTIGKTAESDEKN